MTQHNDEPVLEDNLGRDALICDIGHDIARTPPLYVFGVHGDWGSGKTSFLHQLQLFLTGYCPQQDVTRLEKSRLQKRWNALSQEKAAVDWQPRDNVTVIWFEAWRYQDEKVPIVALLQEIRTQLPWYSKALTKAGKLTEVSIRAALLAFEDITKRIGIQASKIQEAGERWERDHLAVALPSHTIRKHLEYAINKLIGRDPGDDKTMHHRLVVVVDDLDRCESE